MSLGIFSVLLHLLVQPAPDPTSRQASAIYSSAQANMERQKVLLQSLEVCFSQKLLSAAPNARPPLVVGIVRFFPNVEEWIRYPLVDSGDLPLDPRVLIQDMDASVRPFIKASDKARSLLVDPDHASPNLWKGLLRAKQDLSIREGALNCCVMFGERWMSDFLSSCTLRRSTELSEDPISVELEFAIGASTSETLYIGLDVGAWIRRVRWVKGGKPQMQASILEVEVIDGVSLPRVGSLEYTYGPGARIATYYSYGPPSAGPPESLLEVPLRTIGDGVCVVTDEVTGQKFALGDERLLADLGLSLRPTVEDPAQTPFSASWIALAIIALVIIVLWRKLQPRHE